MTKSHQAARDGGPSPEVLAAAAPAPAVDATQALQAQQQLKTAEALIGSYKKMLSVRDDEFARVLARNAELEDLVRRYEQALLEAAQKPG